MGETGVLVVTEDGVIDVPNAVPVAAGLVETVERIVNALGIPTRDEHEQQQEDET